MDGYHRVFVEHRKRLYRIAWLSCGDEQVAGDAVAEAFAAVFARWADGEISDVGAYLTSAVINTLRQATRRAMVRERYATIAGRLDGMDVGDESVVDRVRLRAVLRELTEEHREVIVLRYYADLSEAAIADALGVPVGTVKSRTSSALAQLRATLGGDDD
jgi:RNA polymerase sigma factor (sigma-70 family)